MLNKFEVVRIRELRMKDGVVKNESWGSGEYYQDEHYVGITHRETYIEFCVNVEVNSGIPFALNKEDAEKVLLNIEKKANIKAKGYIFLNKEKELEIDRNRFELRVEKKHTDEQLYNILEEKINKYRYVEYEKFHNEKTEEKESKYIRDLFWYESRLENYVKIEPFGKNDFILKKEYLFDKNEELENVDIEVIKEEIQEKIKNDFYEYKNKQKQRTINNIKSDTNRRRNILKKTIDSKEKKTHEEEIKNNMRELSYIGTKKYNEENEKQLEKIMDEFSKEIKSYPQKVREIFDIKMKKNEELRELKKEIEKDEKQIEELNEKIIKYILKEKINKKD